METPDYLKAIKAFGGDLTANEKQSLSEMPELVGEKNPDGSWAGKGPMVVPARPSGTYEEQLAAFAKLQFIDHEATPAEIETFVSGRAASTSDAQAPADEADPWEADAAPESPVSASTPPVAAPVAEPPPVSASTSPVPEAPVDDAPVNLPPGHTYVRTLPDGRIVAMFRDPSYPRSPAREIILPNPAKVRGKEIEHARRAAEWERAGRRAAEGSNRKVSR